MNITGIILAGGKSTRMGTDKALLEIEGKTFLNRSIEFCQLFCTQVIISSNSAEHEIAGIKRIADVFENCGPLGGIYACLKQSETDWNFVLSVDSAFILPDFVKFLISEIEDFDAIVPAYKNEREPLIAFYQKRIVEIIHEKLMSGDYKMQNLLKDVNTKFVDSNEWVENYPRLFRNLNRPEDF